jgi:hypothetical protein
MPTLTAIHIAKAPQAIASTKALSKSMSVPTHKEIADPDKTKISA